MEHFNRNLKLLLTFLLVIIFNSCSEKYNLQLNDIGRITINGLITNDKGPYYVQLTLSTNGINNLNSGSYFTMGDTLPVKKVNSALVIIADNAGNADTLTTLSPTTIMYDNYKNPVTAIFTDYAGKTFTRDLIYGNLTQRDLSAILQGGFYRTNNILGLSGRTYTLTVKWQGQEYKATSYMPSLPKIDSLSYQIITKSWIGVYLYSIVYFRINLNENSYFLFSNRADYWSGGENSYSLSDYKINNINQYGYKVNWNKTDNNPNLSYLLNYLYSYQKDTMVVYMYSITEEAYNLHDALLKSINNDGGAYSQAPATAPSNFSNNALGFFQASSVIKLTKSFDFTLK